MGLWATFLRVDIILKVPPADVLQAAVVQQPLLRHEFPKPAFCYPLTSSPLRFVEETPNDQSQPSQMTQTRVPAYQLQVAQMRENDRSTLYVDFGHLETADYLLADAIRGSRYCNWMHTCRDNAIIPRPYDPTLSPLTLEP